MSDALQRLIHKDEIRDLMARYCRGVDRADWDAVRATYHTDAYDDHGDYKGGIDGFIEFAKSRTGGATQVMHFLGECLIEFAKPDVAVAETYFFTAHTLGPEAQRQYGASAKGDPVQLSHYGRYVDRVERRAGVWRIAIASWCSRQRASPWERFPRSKRTGPVSVATSGTRSSGCALRSDCED